MQKLKDLDQSIKELSDSSQAFLNAFKFQLERMDEMERMFEDSIMRTLLWWAGNE